MTHPAEPVLLDVPESLSPLARYKREHGIEMRMHDSRYVVTVHRGLFGEKGCSLTSDAATEIKALNRLASLAMIPTFEQWRYANHV